MYYVLHDSTQRGPLWNVLKVCKEYGLYDLVKSSMETGEYISKVLWKRVVRESLANLEHKRWRINCKLYRTLHFMSVYHMSAWWLHAYHDHAFSKQNRVILRLLLNVKMYAEIICPCCDINVVNCAVHVLFGCSCNEEQRVLLWNLFVEKCPQGLRVSLERMSYKQKTKFILNACNSYYLHEWKEIFDSLSNFIYHTSKVYDMNMMKCVNESRE